MTKSDWAREVQLRGAGGAGADVTGWTFEFLIRAQRSSPTALLTLNSAPGIAVVDAPGGKIRLALTGAQTSSIGAGDRAFALYRTDGGRRLCLVSGKMIVREGV